MPEADISEVTPKILQLGDIRYDIERGEMWQGEDLIRLTSTESQLMRIFSAQPHEPVSRSKLVEDLGRDRGQAQERRRGRADHPLAAARSEPNPKQPLYLQTVARGGLYAGP